MARPWFMKILVGAAWSSFALTLIGWALIAMDEQAGLVCAVAGPFLGLLTFLGLARSAARTSKTLALISGLGGAVIMFMAPFVPKIQSVLFVGVTGGCLCLLLACLTKWLRWRLFIPALILGVGLFAILKVGIFPSEKLTIAVPGPSSEGQTYFGYISSEAKGRPIAEVRGTFSMSTRIAAELFSVRAGVVQPVALRECWRSPNRGPSPIWENLRITFALTNEQGPDGNLTTLCSKGEQRSYGVVDGIRNDIQIVDSRLLTGYLRSGDKLMLYAEGDEKLVIERGMTIEEFAHKNKGNYLVVTITRN